MGKIELSLFLIGLLSAIIGGWLFWGGQENMATVMTFGIGMIIPIVLLYFNGGN